MLTAAVLAQQNCGCNVSKPWWSWRPTVSTGKLLLINDHNHGHKLFVVRQTGAYKAKICGAVAPLLLLRTATECKIISGLYLSWILHFLLHPTHDIAYSATLRSITLLFWSAALSWRRVHDSNCKLFAAGLPMSKWKCSRSNIAE